MTGVLDHSEVSDRPTYRLPPEAYFEPSWYELEVKELFGKTWNLVGHESQPQGVRRLHHVERRRRSRRRGAHARGRVERLPQHVPAPGHGDRVRLGELRRVAALRLPRLGVQPRRRRARPGCRSARRSSRTSTPRRSASTRVAVATWGGFVFVHPDPTQADTFDEWLGDFPEKMGEYPWSEMVEVGTETVPLKCNWKLYIENHIDWLHLWYLHEATLKQYEHHAVDLRDDRSALVLGRDAPGRPADLRPGRRAPDPRRLRSRGQDPARQHVLPERSRRDAWAASCRPTRSSRPARRRAISTSAATGRRARSSPTRCARKAWSCCATRTGWRVSRCRW